VLITQILQSEINNKHIIPVIEEIILDEDLELLKREVLVQVDVELVNLA
jgi:hypothetical protein